MKLVVLGRGGGDDGVEESLNDHFKTYSHKILVPARSFGLRLPRQTSGLRFDIPDGAAAQNASLAAYAAKSSGYRRGLCPPLQKKPAGAECGKEVPIYEESRGIPFESSRPSSGHSKWKKMPSTEGNGGGGPGGNAIGRKKRPSWQGAEDRARSTSSSDPYNARGWHIYFERATR